MRARNASASATAAFMGTSLALLAVPAPARAQDIQPYEGFLCCNLHRKGSWISDWTDFDKGHTLVAAGTPVKVSGFGRWRVRVEIDGKKLELGNDYSRTMSMEAFAKRYVVPENPARALASLQPKVREAIQGRKVTRGMTRDQVLMALSYPTTRDTPDLEAPVWNYHRDGYQYQIFWTDDRRVDQVFGDPATRGKVVLE